MELPNVVTKVRNESFTLSIFAYRKLTKAEIDLSITTYLRQNGNKTLPKEGKGKLITTIGAFDT